MLTILSQIILKVTRKTNLASPNFRPT
jgi:hypothetical protein